MPNPSILECPLPQVAEALGPYIRSREEADRIRREITRSLQKDGSRINSINLANGSANISESALKGCWGPRHAYLGALQAHRQAQERLKTLRAEVDEMQATSRSRRAVVSKTDTRSAADAITYIRSKQRQEHLHIIESALDQVSEQTPLEGELEDRLGDIPLAMPEAVSATHTNLDADVQSGLLDLKKAILRARSEVAKHKMATATREASTDRTTAGPTIKTRIHALRTARDTLIELIEGQLAKLSDSTDQSDTNADNLPMLEDGDDAIKDDKRDVDMVYEQYVEARQILATVLSRRHSGSRPLAASATPSTSDSHPGASQIDAHPEYYAHLLSLASKLRESSEGQQTLLQHMSYMRRQLALASAETKQTVMRLADESLMIDPGAMNVSAWAAAAVDARTRDGLFIESKLEDGGQALQGARHTLDRLDGIAQMQ